MRLNFALLYEPMQKAREQREQREQPVTMRL